MIYLRYKIENIPTVRSFEILFLTDKMKLVKYPEERCFRRQWHKNQLLKTGL